MNNKPVMLITCFQCGYSVPNHQFTNPSDFILDQVKYGWRADGLRIFCPNCAGK